MGLVEKMRMFSFIGTVRDPFKGKQLLNDVFDSRPGK
jgi:hypothetical protein